jgi:hypothetical protein
VDSSTTRKACLVDESHDDSVVYVRELLREVPLDGWEFRKRSDATYIVWGPCPMCKGLAFGPPDRHSEPLTARELGVFEIGRGERGVPASCQCGHDHGEESERSCGRYWIVRVGVDD